MSIRRWHVNNILLACVMKDEIISKSCIKQAIHYLPIAAVLVRGRALEVDEINAAALTMMQLDKNVIGRTLSDAIPSLEGQSILDTLHALYKSKENNIERHADGIIILGDVTCPVQFSFRLVSQEEILLVIHRVKMADSHDLTFSADDFATSVIESAGLGAFDFDVARKSFRSSKRFAEIFGFDAPVPFEGYMLRIHPDDHSVRERAREDVKYHRKILYDIRLVMPDETIRWVRIKAKIFCDEQGGQHRWIGSAEDITIEKKSFQELQESEARFRSLITETPEVATALYVGPDIRIQFVNQVMLRFWGKDESIVGKSFIEALPETMDQPFYDQLRNVYFTGITYSNKDQKTLLKINGQLIPRYYSYTYKPLRNANGEIYGIHHMALDVTDEVLAKQQLIQSEESVRQLFMLTPVGIGVLKGESLVIDLVNDAMLAYWKRTREEVVNKPLWEVFPEIALQGFDQITRKVFKTGESYYSPETAVEMFRNGKLETVYIHFAFEALRDNNGNISGMLSIGNDVTDLVMARKKSESNEARLQSLADSMPQLVWIAEEDGRVIYYNNQVRKYEGINKKHNGTWEWRGIVHVDDISRTRDAWSTAVEDKTLYEIEHRIKMNDGTFRWHLSRAFPQTEDGHMTWYGTATDIQQVKDAEMAVRESEERFRIMADATPSIIWALTPQGTHRYLNRFALDYLGIRPEEISTLSWDAHIHPDDLASTQRVLSEALENRTPYSKEHRLRRYDGEYRWFLAKGAPSYYINGDLYGFVGSGTDIHEWKLAQQILKKNEEILENLVSERTLELQRSNNDLQQFAHVASHDLKEPIRKIKTFSYKLQDEFENTLNERGNSLLNKIIHSSDRMYAMINGILNYSVVSSDKGNLQHVDLNAIIRNVRNDLELLISEKNASIEYNDLPMVCANVDLIHQLFYNLINNSLKFSKANQASVIRITWQNATVHDHPYVEILIEDNGIGFDREYADHIFGTFVRLHSKDRYEGSGLGLALCKRIVERYGGSIVADGKDGSGATFTFTLPT